MLPVLRELCFAVILTAFSWAVAFTTAHVVPGPVIAGRILGELNVSVPAEYVVFLTTFGVCGMLARQYVPRGSR